MKTYKIKNYKGNLVESLSKFAKSHKGMRIVEAVEDEDELKVKAEVEEATSPKKHERGKVDAETVQELIDVLTQKKNKYGPDCKLITFQDEDSTIHFGKFVVNLPKGEMPDDPNTIAVYCTDGTVDWYQVLKGEDIIFG